MDAHLICVFVGRKCSRIGNDVSRLSLYIFLQIEVPSDYESNEPPKVFCETDIYHPNIDTTDDEYDTSGSNVCLNLLDRGTWNRKFGLEGAVLGLVFLLHNPNLEDPLAPDIENDLEVFEENVKLYMRGEEVDGRCFSADFLKHLQPDVNSDSDNAAHNNTAELADESTNTDTNPEVRLLEVDNENTDCQGTFVKAVEQNVSHGESETKTEEHPVVRVDCGDKTACQATDGINSSTEVNASKTNYNKIDGNETHVTGDMAIEESLLSQIEKMGIMEETVPDDSLEGCTMVTVEDDIILASHDAAQCLQENINKLDTEEAVDMTSAAHKHRDESLLVDYLTMANTSNSEENDDDSFRVVHSIFEEVVENVMNISSDEDEKCTTGPIINILTFEENNEIASEALASNDQNKSLTMANTSNSEEKEADSFSVVHSVMDEVVQHVMNTSSDEDENCKTGLIINIIDNNDNCCATSLDAQTMICNEMVLRKSNFTRQKSVYMRNCGHFFQTCTPYLKCILYHILNCFAKL